MWSTVQSVWIFALCLQCFPEFLCIVLINGRSNKLLTLIGISAFLRSFLADATTRFRLPRSARARLHSNPTLWGPLPKLPNAVSIGLGRSSGQQRFRVNHRILNLRIINMFWFKVIIEPYLIYLMVIQNPCFTYPICNKESLTTWIWLFWCLPLRHSTVLFLSQIVLC